MGKVVIGEYDRLQEAGWRFCDSGAMAGHLNFNMGFLGQKMIDAAAAARIGELAEQLVGEPVTLIQAVGNLNLPKSHFQDFHIDGPFEKKIFIANICLVPTNETNGATQMVPGSHLSRRSYWQFWREELATDAIAVDLSPGDVLIRLSNVWHRGTPNYGIRARPMAALTWIATRLADGSSAERDLARPLTIFANKYYGRLRKLKEFIAVRLPWLDETIRIGKSVIFEAH